MASSVVEGGGDMAEEEEGEESDEDSEDTKDNFSFKVLMNTITRYERRRNISTSGAGSRVQDLYLAVGHHDHQEALWPAGERGPGDLRDVRG